MKTSDDAIRGIRYKLRMMVVTLTGPTYIWWQHVFNLQYITTWIDPKEENQLYLLLCRTRSSSEWKCLTSHCKTGDNYSDMMSKVLYGQKKWDKVSRILYDIWDHEYGLETAKGWLFCRNLWHDQDHSGTCLHVFCFTYPYDMTKTTNTPSCMYFYVCKINIH